MAKLSKKEQKQIARAAKKKEAKKKASEQRARQKGTYEKLVERQAALEAEKKKAIEQKELELKRRAEEARKLEAKRLKRQEQKEQARLRKLKKSQQSEYEINLKRLTALLITQVQGSGQNIMNVMDDPSALKTNLQVLIKKYPDLTETADRLLEQRKLELGEGIYRDEAMINQLEMEFRANPNRLSNRNNIRYDSGMLDINAYMVSEAVYRVFKDEALEKGISNEMFKRALDEVTVGTPYLLYEGTKNSRGHISRERKFKAPREIANMVMAIALNDGHVDEREVIKNAW